MNRPTHCCALHVSAYRFYQRRRLECINSQGLVPHAPDFAALDIGHYRYPPAQLPNRGWGMDEGSSVIAIANKRSLRHQG